MKLATPYADLAQKMAWAQHTPEAPVKFIGVVELAGALGLILPAATLSCIAMPSPIWNEPMPSTMGRRCSRGYRSGST